MRLNSLNILLNNLKKEGGERRTRRREKYIERKSTSIQYQHLLHNN
jgi:hypothetical protein